MAPFSKHSMANIKSAAKRARQGEVRRARNISVVNSLKSGQKKLRAALAAGKLDEAKAEYVKVSSALDKAAKRGVIHKNSAARKKGAFNRAPDSRQGLIRSACGRLAASQVSVVASRTEWIERFWNALLPEALDFLRRQVEVNSFTGHRAGVLRNAEIVAAQFQALGFAAQSHPARAIRFSEIIFS